jgi:hypothetical protein
MAKSEDDIGVEVMTEVGLPRAFFADPSRQAASGFFLA